MKISLSSLQEKLEAQRRRIESKHAFTNDPIKPDFKLIDFNGRILSDYTYPTDEPDVRRYCICVVPCGTFIDAPERGEKGFRLPCVDSIAPIVTEAKLNRYKNMADKFRAKQKELAPGVATGGEKFTSQAEIDAARAEAKVLQEQERKSEMLDEIIRSKRRSVRKRFDDW